jgi:hypothetical protein
MLKQFIKEWYKLNKTQRRGTIVVLILLLSSVLFKWLYVPKLDDEVIYFANLEIEKFKKPENKSTSNIFVTKKDTLFSSILILLQKRNCRKLDCLKKLFKISSNTGMQVESFILKNH